MSEIKKPKLIRKFKGEVVADKMAKTVTVRVDHFKMHPRYHKQYRVSKKYKVHDEKGQYKVGDAIEFIECRPLSKDKRWRVINK